LKNSLISIVMEMKSPRKNYMDSFIVAIAREAKILRLSISRKKMLTNRLIKIGAL